MKDNFKMTKEIAGRLDIMARELPPVAKTRTDGSPVMRNVTVTGAKILADGYVPKAGDPPIDPKVMYQAPVLVFYNHRQEMENIYKKQGLPGVATYMAMIKNLKANVDRSLKKPPFFNRLINKLKSIAKK